MRAVPAKAGSAARYRQGLPDESEFWPEERLRAYQWRRLRRVVGEAFEHLPFYRRRWEEAGFDMSRLRGMGDLRLVPTFTKADVVAAMRERGRWDAGLERWAEEGPAVLCTSSGTVGTSLLYLPHAWQTQRGRSTLRAYAWAGLRPGMTAMTAAPAWHSSAVQEAALVERLGVRLVYPWGTFIPRYADGFLDGLLDVRPQFLFLFLPMLYAMLAECGRRGMDPREAFRPVETVLAVGAPLTPGSRKHLEQELETRVLEGAGVSEALTAMECEARHGHHVMVDTCLVEVLDRTSGESLAPGNRGTLVLTSLIPHGSVYIRYDTEDVAELLPGPCPCGRTWPQVRLYDRWTNALEVGGRYLVPYDVRVCLDELPELLGVPFAVVRTSEKRALRVAVQRPEHGRAPAELERAVAGVTRGRLGVEAEVSWAESLPFRWKGQVVIDEEEWNRWQAQSMA